MGEHGYESVRAETIRDRDSILTVFGRKKVVRVVEVGDRITFHLEGGKFMRTRRGRNVEKMRT